MSRARTSEMKERSKVNVVDDGLWRAKVSNKMDELVNVTNAYYKKCK